jgi:uncharacterized membrane protein YqgA involved in biofilm formation
MTNPIKYPDFIQSGTITDIAKSSSLASTVTFSSTFTSIPKVFVQEFAPNAASTVRAVVQGTSTAEFTIWGDATSTFMWIAVRSDV